MDVEKRPVVSGLLALVAVAVVVGLVGGFMALAGARMFGLGGEVDADAVGGATPTSGETLTLPKPTKTPEPSDPLVTLVEPSGDDEEGEGDENGDGAPGPDEAGTDKKDKKDKKKKDKKKDKDEPAISLSASPSQVGSMDRIDLTGTFPKGEGAILQVQRKEDGSWEDFPVTVSVSNRTFSTYVMTGRTGANVFRVVDSDSDRASNPVKVTVG